MLEIGCGWGSFAEYVARSTGCEVTGIAVSRKPYEYARRGIYEAGLTERVSIEFRDCRDVNGRFGRIASIEMFEAVDERYWPVFFRRLRNGLSTGGRATLRIITIDDARFESYCRRADFIQRHIFPGGVLPSRAALLWDVADARMTWLGDQGFANHYAETLAAWRERFLAAGQEIEAMGYPDRFRRMGEFYLAYCEAGFRIGRTGPLQISLGR